VLSGDEREHLDRLGRCTRTDDPAFADGLSTGWPRPPWQCRRARRRRAACLSAAAVLLAGAVATAEHAVVSAVVLLTGIGFVLASLLADPSSLDLPPGDDMTDTGR
jgi:Protein of unknown function (DUF3040)